MDEVKLYDIPPKPPKCQHRYEGLNPEDYSKNINKYRIIKRTGCNVQELGGYQPSSTYYNVQLNIGWFIFNKWINVGPDKCDTADEAYQWIQKTIYSQLEPTEQVIWTGKYSQNPPSP